jgi:hypothetical protein
MREDAPQRPGAAVRGYRIERLIGTGGAAAVYEARRLGPGGPGERVACKVMHAARRDEPRDREQVRQEAVLGLRVTAGHRNLVEILDFFDDPDAQHCIVMELVDGASVAELRGPDRRLPFPVTRRVAVEVLEALVHLHGRGVLHRDLSPRNILVTAGGVVKVADLGIARVMEQGLVHTATLRVTAMYAPREAIELLPLDVRADLFSLGAVLYDLVTGTPPCGDQELVARMLARNAAGQFAPLPPDTPADLAELITGMIRVERSARRPQTAAEALDLLRRHDQPMASEAELAGMVPSAQERRDRELADDPPASALAPGHVLAPRDALAAVKAPPDGVAGHVARLEAGAVLARLAEAVRNQLASDAADAVPDSDAAEAVRDQADSDAADAVRDQADSDAADAVFDHAVSDAADAVPHYVDDSRPYGVPDRAADVVPGRVTAALPDHAVGALPDRVIDAVLDRVIDALPERVIDAVPERTSGGMSGRGPGAARRLVARRAVHVVAVMACVVVLGFLLDDGFRGEQTAIEQTAPVVVVVPTPAPPVSPVVVTHVPTLESPRRAPEPLDDSRHERAAVQRRDRPARPSAPRWRSAPHVSEPPLWGQR